MRTLILAAAALLVFAGPAVAADDGGAMGQLENATSGHQTLSQTYGDTDRDPGCPDSCPNGADAGTPPEPPAPTPVDEDN
jgi:hypothetical protein